MKISKQNAKEISELINTLTVWNSAIERNKNPDEVIQMMGWHEEVADQLMNDFGIDVVRYKLPELA
jgi:hypothetical protein